MEYIMDLAENNESDTSFKQNFESKLVEYDQQHQGSQRKPWTKEKIIEVINNVRQARVAMNCKSRRTSMEYYWMSKYDIMTAGNEEHLIFKRKSTDDPTVLIISREEYFGVLQEAHKSCGHGGRDKILHAIKTRFYIPKKAVELFVTLCPTCENKRNVPKKGIITRPTVSQDFNIRGQVDLMDFQSCPSGEYKWLLNYQDNATKFLSLRPLKTKEANEVAVELMKIFMIFGAPYILESDNGREFTAKIIEELTAMWHDCKIVLGSPRPPQTQGSVERSNQDIENMLRSWMTDNKSASWSLGCYHVQYQKNSSFHPVIERSPYKALFGNDPKAGLSGSTIPHSVLMNIETEEQLKNLSQQEFSDNVSGQHCNNRSVTECNSLDTTEKPNEPNENSHEDSVIIESRRNLNTDFKYGAKIEIEPYQDPQDQLGTGAQEITDENATCDQTDEKARVTKVFEEIDVKPNLSCVVCHNACTGAYSCSLCKNFVHVICALSEEEDEGSKILCFLCKIENNIQLQRNEAHTGIKRPAEKMVESTATKLAPLVVGGTVLISVPKVDRGPLNTKYIKGKIVDFRNGVYRVGTCAGTLKNWFPRQDLHISSEDYNYDISNLPISLREAVTNQSIFGAQGFQKCTCKPAQKQCRNNRCACFKKNVLCGSKCHSSLSCVNK